MGKGILGITNLPLGPLSAEMYAVVGAWLAAVDSKL